MPQEKKLIGVLSLRKKLADTRKKLQDYGDTIVSLRSELRTLREGICVTCKRKFVPQNSEPKSWPVGPLSLANRRPRTQVLPEVGLSPQRHHAPESSTPKISGPSISKIPRYSFSNSPRPLRSKLSQSLPISSAPTRIPRPLPKVVASYEKSPPIFNQQVSSSKAVLPKIEPSVPLWSVERGALDQALEVSFVRALINKYGVNSVRFSPDGKYLAAGLGSARLGRNGAIVVYNVETGQQTCVLVEHSSQYFLQPRPSIQCLSFSPDGRYLAAGDTNHQVWNIQNKRICSIFEGPLWSTLSVTFSPKGRFLISVSSYGGMRLWKLRDGTARSFSANYGDSYWCAGFSPDEKHIAVGSMDGMLTILDVRTGRMVKRWNSDGGLISCVTFTLDGMGLLSGHEDGSVINWNIESRRGAVATRTLKYKDLEKRITEIAFPPGARWAAAVSGNKAVTWVTCNGLQQCTLIGHKDQVASVDFSPSGKYLALGSWDGYVTVWKYVSS